MEQVQREVSRPIRLILSFSDDYRSGFNVVYEREDGTANRLFVSFRDELFSKIRFVEKEKSRVVWTVTTAKRQVGGGGLFKKPPIFEDQEYWEIKEIIIRRNRNL